MRDAIMESEVGPKILYHFAEYPEVADLIEQDLKSMPAGGISSDQLGETINSVRHKIDVPVFIAR
jgi:hypothetical protein